jgi:type I restriction enzyme, S subunit
MRKVKLGDTKIEIIDGDRGKNYPSKSEFFTNGFCVFLDASNVTKSGFNLENPLYISKEKSDLMRNGKLKKDDIVITTRGTVGNLAHYNDNINYKNIRINSGMLIIRNSTDFNTKYLYYLFKSDIVAEQIKQKTTGSSQPQITVGILNELILLIPPLPTQTAIARVLSSLDEKIELNNKINKELENLAKTIYDYWFVQFNFSNKKNKPYKTSGGKMVYNENLKKEIPEGWEVKKIDEVALLQYGYPFDTRFFNDEQIGLPVIRIRDVLENTISSYTTEKNIDKKYELNIGDLLIGMDGNFHINHWYRAGCYLNQRVVRVRKNGLSTFLIKYQIEPYIKLKENSCSGSTVGHLSDKDVKALKIVVPPQNLRDKFNKQFDNILSKILSTQNEVQNLAQLRDFLLPLLMNGQVKVNIKK